MSERYEDKNSAEIQREIDRTRSEMSETLDELRHSLSPGELVDQAMTYLKDGGAGQFTSNLSETIKQNPVPTALIGIGIAWLMMGGGSRQTSAPSFSYRDEGERFQGVGSRARNMVGRASEQASTMAQSAREGTSTRLQGAQAAAGGARERAGEMAHHTRERVGGMAQGVQHQMEATADQVRSQMGYQTERARQSITYLLHEQPLVLGALGFALGAALGAGLPSTALEDEIMGETRDEYVQRAKEMGEEQLEKVQQVATAAGQAAQAQLQNEGVTQGNADEQVRQATEVAERVVQASRDAAEQEARNQD
jgi:hypothetical protein